MRRAANGRPLKVVVFLQENKSTDFYFRSLREWGADVADLGPPLTAAPDFDQPHDRNAWVHFSKGDYAAEPLQIDNDALIPYYSWLAKEFSFSPNHFGLGSNSTSGHMLALGGQTATLKNPPFTGAHPTWDMPTILGHAGRNGLTWGAFPDAGSYPVKYYTELTNAPENIHPTGDFVTMAQSGTLPDVSYVWAPDGHSEHPPSRSGTNPTYLQDGQDAVWKRVDAVVQAGDWDNTVFILTWDDWGGYADHVKTPAIETAVDATDPQGYPIIGGSRLPLIMFGGAVVQGIDPEWHSHASIPKTIIDLFGLPPIGIDRVDTAPSLAGRVDLTLQRPAPPAFGSAITQPAPPSPAPQPVAPQPWAGPLGRPLAPVVLNGGLTMPAPADAVVSMRPPVAPTPPAARSPRPSGAGLEL